MNIQDNIRSYYTKLSREFWRHTNRLFAMRATISIALVSIPFFIAGLPYFGVTLSLGALAGALSETDDHPKGRVKALLITVASFFISSFAVGVLYDKVWILGAGFIASTVVFVLIGGLGERYRAVTFGSILVGIYAMLGSELSPEWYWPAVLLPAGALFHGILALILLIKKPWRLLDEQMAKGFNSLANYLEVKARLFPSTKEEQATINNDLALLNITVVNTLEKIKEVLNNYDRELNDPERLRPYLQRFMTLQSLHERASSSHERHDKLSNKKQRIEVIEGIGEMLRQMVYALRQMSENMLTGVEYHHPPAIDLISKAIESNLEKMDPVSAQPLVLLHHNLYRSHISLKYLDNAEQGTSIPRLRKDERSTWEKIRAMLSLKHPRMRYAIRLSLSFLIGFIIQEKLNMDKGAWVMLTSLFVSQITYTDTRRRLFERLLGTVTGVVLGILLLSSFTTISAQVMMMLSSALLFFYWLRTQYSIAVIFITTFVISAFNLISGDSGFHIMIPRLVDTLLGASISFFVIRLLWPGWQYKRIPDLVAKVLEKNRVYLLAIKKEYQVSSDDDFEYRVARREAHLAGNDLAQAWNSMRMEPRSKQQLMKFAFSLTYENHALLSYISALGAHRRENLYKIDGRDLLVNLISEALSHASKDVAKGEFSQKPDLSPLVLDLKHRIAAADSVVSKQQLRLFYNITGVVSKIMDELYDEKGE